ncbi:hypothetical protein BuS5_03645 [Desulfosarcina sp. BuS5]|uniref:hypothetical protein n=1 Tax=Desulfosarcina sp. BuS5 TaxID=933262 RepID=UPI0004893779|nr:hypothetical protein [Desulfosarcina sp. BuS5]WDN90674.1 hypothetical protein BuS5_03645 [Desulfosarcina sp. BuS5]
MNNILSYKRNRSTCVEQMDDYTMKSYCRFQDTFTEAYVEIMVCLPDLEITGATGEFTRSLRNECLIDINESLKRVIGVRIGSGMLKILKGLMGAKTDCRELIFMVEECCHGIILAFTKKKLLFSPKDEKEKHEYYANMVKENIRMYNRCAAFAPGSSFVDKT